MTSQHALLRALTTMQGADCILAYADLNRLSFQWINLCDDRRSDRQKYKVVIC